MKLVTYIVNLIRGFAWGVAAADPDSKYYWVNVLILGLLFTSIFWELGALNEKIKES